jgi:hypothetical protein
MSPLIPEKQSKYATFTDATLLVMIIVPPVYIYREGLVQMLNL